MNLAEQAAARVALAHTIGAEPRHWIATSAAHAQLVAEAQAAAWSGKGALLHGLPIAVATASGRSLAWLSALIGRDPSFLPAFVERGEPAQLDTLDRRHLAIHLEVRSPNSPSPRSRSQDFRKAVANQPETGGIPLPGRLPIH